MIGKRIPQLPPAGPVDGTEQAVIEQGGKTRRVLFYYIIEFISYLRDSVGAVRRSLQSKLDDSVSVKDFGAKGNGVTDDTAAIKVAIDSGMSLHFPAGRYVVQGSGVVVALNRQRVYGLQDAEILVNGSVGFDVTSMSNSEISGFRFLGASADDGKIGIRVANMNVSDIHNNEFRDLSIGVQANAKTREPWYGGINFVPASISYNRIQKCGTGVKLLNNAEYIAVSDNQIFGCTVAGIYSEAGNCPIRDNTITACEWGIHVKGNGPSGVSLDNPEHSSISGNTVNHCNTCGIYLEDIFLSTLLTGNQVWAVATGPAFLTYGKSFGLFMKNSRRIASVGNVYSESAYNIGFDGLADSSFDDAIQHTASPITFYMWCEGNGAFTDNRNVSLTTAPTNSGAVEDVIGNYSSASNRLFRIRAKALAQGAELSALVTSDYKLDGRQDEVLLTNDYVHSIIVPDYRRGTNFSINVLNVITPKTVVFPVGTTLTSSTASAVVSGASCTLVGAVGKFTFTATPDQASWIITYEGKPPLALKDSTAAGTAYTLTTTVSAVDFGTTDPSITLTEPGTYLVEALVRVDAQAATVGTTQNLDLRIRRTNNTPADIDQTIIDLAPLTAQTLTVGTYVLKQKVVTVNNNDILTIFAGLSAALGAGTMTISKAMIFANKVY